MLFFASRLRVFCPPPFYSLFGLKKLGSLNWLAFDFGEVASERNAWPRLAFGELLTIDEVLG